MKQLAALPCLAFPAKLDPSARYIFRINAPLEMQAIEKLRASLIQAGFKDCLLVDANIDIFALPPLDAALQQARVLGGL